jgi:hypothetical protein
VTVTPKPIDAERKLGYLSAALRNQLAGPQSRRIPQRKTGNHCPMIRHKALALLPCLNGKLRIGAVTFALVRVDLVSTACGSRWVIGKEPPIRYRRWY